MKVECRIFESKSKSWEDLTKEASDLATMIGKERLINISVSAHGGADITGLGAKGTVFVWYWS